MSNGFTTTQTRIRPGGPNKAAKTKLSGRMDVSRFAQMNQDVELAEEQHYREMKRDMSPSERRIILQNALARSRYGAGPLDLLAGKMLGGGSERFGRSIDEAQIVLAAKAPMQIRARFGDKAKDGPGVFELLEIDAQLATRQNTKAAGTATDKSPQTAFSDTAYVGSTAAILPATFWAKILRKNSRKTVFLPLCHQEIAPDMMFQFALRTNSIISELFTTETGQTLGSFKPRKEGKSGSFLRSKHGNANLSARSYIWHAMETQELVDSNGNKVLNIVGADRELLEQAPGIIVDQDIIQGYLTGINLGYTRRFDDTANDWVVNVQEVPWGKATFIEDKNKDHVMYWDFTTGKFYQPATTANTNYLKYQSSTLYTGPGVKGSGNGFLEALSVMDRMMDEKNEELEVVFVHGDLLREYGLDERAQNSLYAPDNVRFSGEEGYVGDIKIVGSNKKVSIFKLKTGHVPAMTTVTPELLTIDYIMIGASLGKVMTNMPFWPTTFFTTPAQEVVTVDSQSVTVPMLADIMSLYHMEVVEPLNLYASVMMKVMKTAHA